LQCYQKFEKNGGEKSFKFCKFIIPLNLKILKGLLSLLLALILSYTAYTQRFIADHRHNISQLTNAKDSLYENILKAYDVYITKQPEDVNAQLERCKFIENAYYDSYEDYNPNFEMAQACADSLLKKFPDNPEVLLYPAEFLYSDTMVAYLKNLEVLIKVNDEVWQPYSWRVYEKLANHYSFENNDERAIHYGELAIGNNDTLDLSLLLGQSYKNLSNKHSAIDILVSHLDSTDAAWELNKKGKLLLELGVSDKAIEAFSMASKINAVQEDAQALAQAMIDNGLYSEARAYLLKDYQSSTQWNSIKTLNALLNYDLRYGDADSARLNYERLTTEDFTADVFGVYRLRLLIKDPLIGWSLSDLGRVLLLVVVLGLALIIPYLWVLPIHYYGQYQKSKGIEYGNILFHWRLRHFWIACSLWIICSALSAIFFYYPEILSYFNSDLYVEEAPLMSKQTANANLFFFTSVLIFSIAMLRSEDIAAFLRKIRHSLGDIGVGIGLAFVLRIGFVIYVMLLRSFGIDLQSDGSGMASINEIIKAINHYYNPLLGFLFVVIFAPFYEEILFRGVFLSSCARNMKFLFANMLQSLVFALIHQEPKYFLFYFAFGLLAGHFTRKSESLITGTSMHMTNNLMAFVYIV
jgi:uncharacterized protein